MLSRAYPTFAKLYIPFTILPPIIIDHMGLWALTQNDFNSPTLVFRMEFAIKRNCTLCFKDLILLWH